MLSSRKAIVLRFDPNVQLSIAKLEYFSNKYTNTLTHTGGGVGVVKCMDSNTVSHLIVIIRKSMKANDDDELRTSLL